MFLLVSWNTIWNTIWDVNKAFSDATFLFL